MRLSIFWFLLPIYSCRTEWTNSMLFTRKSPLQLNYRRTTYISIRHTFSGQISDGERQTSLATPFSSMIMEFGSGICKSTFRQEGRSISLSKQVQLSQLEVSVFWAKSCIRKRRKAGRHGYWWRKWLGNSERMPKFAENMNELWNLQNLPTPSSAR